MERKTIKSMLVACVMAVMLIGLSACGSGGASGNTAAATSSEPSSDAASGVEEPSATLISEVPAGMLTSEGYPDLFAIWKMAPADIEEALAPLHCASAYGGHEMFFATDVDTWYHERGILSEDSGEEEYWDLSGAEERAGDWEWKEGEWVLDVFAPNDSHTGKETGEDYVAYCYLYVGWDDEGDYKVNFDKLASMYGLRIDDVIGNGKKADCYYNGTKVGEVTKLDNGDIRLEAHLSSALS